MKSYPIGKLDGFAEGSRKVVSCDGTEIGVFMIDGESSPGTINAHIGRGPCAKAASTSGS